MFAANVYQSAPASHDLSKDQRLESPFVTITQAMISAFAEISGDRNPIHLDAEFAQRMGLRDTVAHGALIFSRATGLAYDFGILVKQSAVFREANLEFRKFVHAGDQIKIVMTVEDIVPLRGGIRKVTLSVNVLNHLGELIQKYRWIAIMQPVR
jgi:3-hydroxybutyryl-CoA dehydratase